MRVVGGKTGADGRLFAYIVWTVPGGPAEKNGLQQGDKVSELSAQVILYIPNELLLNFQRVAINCFCNAFGKFHKCLRNS